MLRTILIGLDGSSSCESAIALGIEWSQRMRCVLVGLTVIDHRPLAPAPAMLFGQGEYVDRTEEISLSEGRQRTTACLDDFTHRCADASLACEVIETVGHTSEEICMEAQRFDLVLLGHHTSFRKPDSDDDASMLRRVLRNVPRPVVIAPEKPRGGRSVLVACTGRLPAARAVYAFQSSGLDFGDPVHVLNVATDEKSAAAPAYRAAEFLRFHQIDAKALPIVSEAPPAQVILEQAAQLDARLIVMGAYGESKVREFFLGSVTRTILDQAEAPLFLSH